MMRDLFDQLNSSDGGMIYGVSKVGEWLTEEASATLNLVDAANYDEANNRNKAACLKVLPSRQAISKAMSSLRQLQAKFIEASGVP